MKVYLCSRYSRRDEMRLVRTLLQEAGHEVTSRWLDTDWERTDGGSSAAPADYRDMYAQIDMDDVRSADAIITFTEAPGVGGRGGRHVEFGMAAAWDKRLFVVGHRENIFHHLPGVQFFTWETGYQHETIKSILAMMG